MMTGKTQQASEPVRTGKKFLDALQGLRNERAPFWFMRQAGRYLPEYRELRARKNGFLAMAMDPKSACEITMQPIRRFGMDAAIIFSDILVIPRALGQKLEFVEGEGPKLDPLETPKHFSRLNFLEFESLLTPVYEALRNTRTALVSGGFGQSALIGFAGAPWTVAAYMIEGGGSGDDFSLARALVKNHPEDFARLMETLVEATSLYLEKQVDAGAEALQIFDSHAGVLDDEDFKRWVIAPTKQIITRVKKKYSNIPVIGFPRGAGENYIDYAKETGITALGLDQHVDTKWAAENLQTLLPVQGNLDPEILRTGDNLENAARQILKDLSDGPHIFNLGHGVHKDTPVEHVERLVRLLQRKG